MRSTSISGFSSNRLKALERSCGEETISKTVRRYGLNELRSPAAGSAFLINADSPLRRILRRGVHIGTVASIGAFAKLCHAQSEVPATNQTAATEGPSIATCVACHGALGAGSEAGAPRLAGKDPDYLAHPLSMFKAGTRISPPMQAMAQSLSESDMRALAVFFSKQHPPLAMTSVPPTALVDERQIEQVAAYLSVTTP